MAEIDLQIDINSKKHLSFAQIIDINSKKHLSFAQINVYG